MTDTHLQDYIERIAHLIRSETRIAGADFDLQPIQQSALHYLAHANRYSDTPQAVTEYFGLTKGTVSQTIKALEAKGLLERGADAQDGRKVHLKVTPAGKKLLKKTMPARTVTGVWADMDEGMRTDLLVHLKNLLQDLQRKNEMNAFGVCKTCRFNRKTGDNRFFCERTQEPLRPAETELLCREHETSTA